MAVSPLPLNCERVRSQISMALDAEVSEFDRRLVAAHLARCADCRAFESPVRAFTEELRAAALESPSEPIALIRSRPRRRAWLATAELSAAATVLIAFGIASQLGASDSQGGNNRLATANLFTTAWSPELELAQIEPAVPTRQTSRPGPRPAL
jgi:predicted anti-sigma-YlaC factor YlaD